MHEAEIHRSQLGSHGNYLFRFCKNDKMKEYIQYWPQIVILIWMTGNTVKSWILDGTERYITTKPVSVWISMATFLFLLIFGGFFNHWGGAQIVYCFIFVLVGIMGIIFTISYKDLIEKSGGKQKISSTFISNLIFFLLYYWGGFFDGLFNLIMK